MAVTVSKDAASAAVALGQFVDGAPTPYHAVDSAMEMLRDAGFVEVFEGQRWPSTPGRYVTTRGGSLVAWSTEHLSDSGVVQQWPAQASFSVVGAHTDSPNLRLKPKADYRSAGWDMLGVEVYGGPLLTTWLDRDLGLAGRVAVRDASASGGYAMRLFRCDEPLLRVANLAIHLDRSSGAGGVEMNRQSHLAPLWGFSGGMSFPRWVSEQVDCAPDDVLSFEAMAYDLLPASLLGHSRELLASPRLDNLCTTFAATEAMKQAVLTPSEEGPARVAGAGKGPRVPVLVLFDHEEIGSETSSGARSQLLASVLERIVLSCGGDRADVLAALSSGLHVSGDMAHAIHPNYADRSEPHNYPVIGGGPVLKVNAQGRYATDTGGAAAFGVACERGGITPQVYVHRTDLPCGSTVGPASAANLGMTTVDVGAAMLSMHSVREVMAARDVEPYTRALAAVLGAEVSAPGLVA
nr:M18 family aminopeptidase [Dermatophilus congolensis]